MLCGGHTRIADNGVCLAVYGYMEHGVLVLSKRRSGRKCLWQLNGMRNSLKYSDESK